MINTEATRIPNSGEPIALRHLAQASCSSKFNTESSRAGDSHKSTRGPQPFIPGWDVSGIVEAVASGVPRVDEGR